MSDLSEEEQVAFVIEAIHTEADAIEADLLCHIHRVSIRRTFIVLAASLKMGMLRRGAEPYDPDGAAQFVHSVDLLEEALEKSGGGLVFNPSLLWGIYLECRPMAKALLDAMRQKPV